MPLLNCDSLHFSYGKHKILAGVDLSLEPGESVLLLGQNGEGKTTLMGCLLGMLRPDSGTVYRKDGVVIAGYISSPAFMEEQTGRTNLLYEAALQRCAGNSRSGCRLTDDGLLEHACSLVGLQPRDLDKRLRQYSTGMRKKIAIARALMQLPDVLVLDEPASGLDPNGIAELRSILQRLRQQEGCSILISSHQIAESAKQATRVAVLNSGKMVRDMPIDQGNGTKWHCRFAQPAQNSHLQLIKSLGGDCVLPDRKQAVFFSPDNEPERVAALLAALVKSGLPVVEFSRENEEIEKVFLEAVSTQ